MSSREFSEWQAFRKKRPFGEFMADIRMATMNSVIWNRGKGPDETVLKFSDFMPDFEPPNVDETDEQKAERARIEAARLVPVADQPTGVIKRPRH